MLEDIEEILISREEMQKKVNELGARISEDYKGQDLVLVCVLKGGVVFHADLMRAISIPVDMDFMAVSSYGVSTKSTGVVRIIKDLDIDIKNKHVLVVEDIVDTGLTLTHLKELLKTRGPLSVKICTALDKPSRRKVPLDIEYRGIEIPDKFVVGYGLDYAEKYRNLPDVCILKPSVYSK